MGPVCRRKETPSNRTTAVFIRSGDSRHLSKQASELQQCTGDTGNGDVSQNRNGVQLANKLQYYYQCKAEQFGG